MPSQQNIDALKVINDKKDKSKSVVFAHYRGLKVNDFTQLRQKIREAGGEVLVTKNTLLRKAFNNNQLTEALIGPTAAIFAYEDEVAPLKIIVDFEKDHEQLPTLTAGYMDNNALSGTELKQLSLLPSKTELQAKVVGTIAAPLSGMVNVLQGNIRNLMYALKAIQDTKTT